jgi:hypothetical protein
MTHTITPSIKTLSMTTFSNGALKVRTLSSIQHSETEQNSTKHYDTQHNNIQHNDNKAKIVSPCNAIQQ